jgi:glycosyltransferase involved in cell wall biosynthesis
MQTFQDFQVILVNDGSTDASRTIALDYFKRYPQLFVLLDKVNGGLSDARNHGIAHATGEYIAFIDSDDYIDSEMFASMLKTAEYEDADIVACDMLYEYEDGTSKYSSAGDFSVGNAKEDLRLIDINNSACNKIFRRSLFVEIRFPKGKLYEDLFIVPILIYRANKLVRVKEAFYHYLQRDGSIVHENNPRMFDIYDALQNINKTLKAEVRDEVELLQIYHAMLIKHGLYLTTLRIKDNGQFANRVTFFKQNMAILESIYPTWFNDKSIQSYPFKTRLLFMLLRYRLFYVVGLLFKRRVS